MEICPAAMSEIILGMKNGLNFEAVPFTGQGMVAPPLLRMCTDATDAGAEDISILFKSSFLSALSPGVTYRFFGYCNGILCVQVHLAGLFMVYIFGSIEAFYFCMQTES